MEGLRCTFNQWITLLHTAYGNWWVIVHLLVVKGEVVVPYIMHLTSPGSCHTVQGSMPPSWVQSCTGLRDFWNTAAVPHYVVGCPTEEWHAHMSMPRKHTPWHYPNVGSPLIGAPAPAHISVNIHNYNVKCNLQFGIGSMCFHCIIFH